MSSFFLLCPAFVFWLRLGSADGLDEAGGRVWNGVEVAPAFSAATAFRASTDRDAVSDVSD